MHRVLLPHGELLLIDARRGALQVRDVEGLHHLCKTQEPVQRRRVAETEEMVEERCRLVTALAVLAHAGSAMSFRQWRGVCAYDQSDVAVRRGGQPEGVEQEQLPRRVRKVIFAAQRVRHAHAGIVHRIGEEKGGGTVGAADNEITNVVAEKTLWPVHEVDESHALACGHAIAQRRGQALAHALSTLAGTELAAGPRITRRLSRRELRAA